MNKLAVVLIRGIVGTRVDTRDTLTSLNLQKKHACAVLEDNLVNRGMLNKVKDFVAYGTISDETFTLLATRKKHATKNVFFLAPPVGGYERKGIKKSFVVGGALGDRKDAMNDLLKKMI